MSLTYAVSASVKTQDLGARWAIVFRYTPHITVLEIVNTGDFGVKTPQPISWHNEVSAGACALGAAIWC